MRKYCFALLLLAGIAWPAEKVFPHRWVYISRRLRSDQDLDDIRRIARTASENGLNGVLLAAGLDSIDLQPPDYLTRLEKAKAIFREYHLEMIPNIFSAGYGGGILAHDKNLAEGLPVKDALYVVKNGEGHIEPSTVVADEERRRASVLSCAELDARAGILARELPRVAQQVLEEQAN